MFVRSMRLLCLSLALVFTTVAAMGCGGDKEKAVIPDKFNAKPDKAPSIGGVPAPGGKGGTKMAPGGGGAASD